MGRTEYNISRVPFIADLDSVDYSMGYTINWDAVVNTDSEGDKFLPAGKIVSAKGGGVFERTQADLTISGITRSGTTATATSSSAHGLQVGDEVLIQGANETEYNGVQTVTAVGSTTTFDYEVSGSPATPATGTITAESEAVGILLEGINQGDKDRAVNGQAVIVGGVVYDSLLPDSGEADFEEYKTELQGAGTGFKWEKYGDDRT